MMKKCYIFLLLLFLPFLNGCGDTLVIEDTTLTVVVGIEEGKGESKYTFYQTSPVFSSEAVKKNQILEIQANSFREAKQDFDLMSNGTVVTGKIQVILFARKMLEKETPMPIIDSFYRDAKGSSNAKIVMYDGPLDELMRLETEDKPRLGIFLNNLLESAFKNETTANTSLLKFKTLIGDNTITPYIAKIQKEKDGLIVTGIALLDNDGKYVASLDKYESALLLLLTKQVNEPVPFMLEINESEEKNVTSLTINKVKYDFEAINDNNELTFKIGMDMDISLEEFYTKNEKREDPKRLKRLIEKEMNRSIEKLVKKIQKNELDPIGFGKYVRAFEYEKWKETEKDWPKAFSNSEIITETKVTINNFGIINNFK